MAAKKKKISSEMAFYQDCFDLVKESSLTLLKQMVGREDFAIKAHNIKDDMTFDHWIGAVMVNIDEARIHIKVHFESRIARHLATSHRISSTEKMPVFIYGDYIKEYLNLLMGEIKRKYNAKNIELSVPQLMPSYDRGVPSEDGVDLNMALWKIVFPKGSLLLSCYIAPYGDLNNLQNRKNTQKDENNVIELL